MSHAIVVAQFQPTRSAFWLTYSAQLAAANIPCLPFWALRFSLYGGSEGTYAPDMLAAMSTLPSSLPIPNASFTLGPKHAIDSGVLSTKATPGFVQLTVQPPLDCLSKTLHHPIYLHTVPMLNIAGGCDTPIEPNACLHQLDYNSLRRFQEAASANTKHVYDAWVTRRGELLAKRLSSCALDIDANTLEQWALANGNGDPTYIFGERHNPHAYCFDFVCDGNLPFCDRPTSIYNELFLYAQLCRDYRWEGVEATIDWVEAIRAQSILKTQIAKPSGHKRSNVTTTTPPVSTFLRKDPVFRDQLAAILSLISHGVIHAGSDSDEEGETSKSRPLSKDTQSSRASATNTGSGSSSGIWVWRLDFNNPTVAEHFPRVRLRHTPRIIVLDMFGVIVDREGAIRTALEPWLPVFHRRPQDIAEAVKLYIELEALAAREFHPCAASLPTIVHSALTALSAKLDVSPAFRLAFLADATASILHPRAYDDAKMQIEELAQYGCTLVGLVPLSTSTLATLRPALPARIWEMVRFFPVAIPLHTPVPDTFFSQLRRWCLQTIGPAGCDVYPPADILVASGGMGRVLGPAAAEAHPTALVMRTGGIECAIEYVVGAGETSPRPSVSVGTLVGLSRAIGQLVSGSELVRTVG